MSYVDLEQQVRRELSRGKDPRGDADATEASIRLVIEFQAAELAAKRPWSSPRDYLVGLGMDRRAASHIVSQARERWRLDQETAADLIERACIDGLQTCDAPMVGTLPGESAGQGYLRNDNGDLIMERDHKARLGYVRELARLHGTDKPTKQETKHEGNITLVDVVNSPGLPRSAQHATAPQDDHA